MKLKLKRTFISSLASLRSNMAMKATLGLLLLLFCHLAVSSFEIFSQKSDAPRTLELHQFTLKQLQNPDEADLRGLREAILHVGMLAVTGIEGGLGPALTGPLGGCLKALAQCSDDGKLHGQMRQVTLPDGSLRMTVATSTNGSVAMPMPAATLQACPNLGAPAATLRRAADSAGRAYAKILDLVVHGSTEHHQKSSRPHIDSDSSRPHIDSDRAFDSFTEAILRSESLEQFHLFQKPDSSSLAASTPALDLHSDVGLFLVMTPAEYFRGKESIVLGRRSSTPDGPSGIPDPGFLLQLPSGQIVRPIIPEGSLLLLNGEGAAKWMKAVPGSPVPTAAPHEVLLPDMSGGLIRAWFGRMYLPPRDATLQQQQQTGSKSPDQRKAITFGEYQQQTLEAFRNGHSDVASTAGCHTSRPFLSDEGSCSDDEIYCWMTCMSIKGLGCNKHDAVCRDRQSGHLWPQDFDGGDTAHCTDCEASCSDDSGAGHTDKNHSGFCNSNLTAIVMWMTGFKAGSTSSYPCVAFLFTSMPLNSGIKFALGCTVTVAMGIAVGGLSWARRHVLLNMKQRTPRDSLVKEISLAGLHAFQLTLAYFLMLVAMTYQVELFVAVIIGLTVGHSMFNRDVVEENPDPCCQ